MTWLATEVAEEEADMAEAVVEGEVEEAVVDTAAQTARL